MNSRVSRFMKSVKTTRKATGWGMLKTIAKINAGRRMGISHYAYVNDACYKKTDKELAKYADYLNNRIEIAEMVAEKTGISVKEATGKLRAAENMGVSNNSYLKYELWNATDAEIADLGETFKAQRKKNRLERKWRINAIAEKAECSHEEAEKRYEAMRSKGYAFFDFVVKAKYMLSEQEILALPNVPKKVIKSPFLDPEVNAQKLAIMEEMGWNETQFKINFFKSKVYTGALFIDYWVNNLYRLDIEEQKKYITHETWVKLYLRHCDYACNWKYFKDKTLFNEMFKEFIKRKWMETKNMDRASFDEFVKGEDEIIFKPTTRACGNGIERMPISENPAENDAVFNKISNEIGMIETIIKQHPYMATLNPNSVNTIRVQTVRWKGEVYVCNAALRMGMATEKCTDNFSNGGSVVVLDVNTGKSVTDGVTRDGRVFEYHPVSNVKFRDIQVPYWDTVIETARKAAVKVDKMNYCGWDVVVNSDGSTQIIEGNHDGGVRLFQFPISICDKRGVRDSIDRFLWFDENEKTI